MKLIEATLFGRTVVDVTGSVSLAVPDDATVEEIAWMAELVKHRAAWEVDYGEDLDPDAVELEYDHDPEVRENNLVPDVDAWVVRNPDGSLSVKEDEAEGKETTNE